MPRTTQLMSARRLRTKRRTPRTTRAPPSRLQRNCPTRILPACTRRKKNKGKTGKEKHRARKGDPKGRKGASKKKASKRAVSSWSSSSSTDLKKKRCKRNRSSSSGDDKKKQARKKQIAKVKTEATKALSKMAPTMKKLREMLAHPKFPDLPQGVISKARFVDRHPYL